MSTRRAQRVDALTDDVTTLAEKVQALHDDLERALEEAEDETAAAERSADVADAADDAQRVVADREPLPTETEDATPARADGGNVGWSEVETAGPDGAKDADQVEWTPIDLE
jgi:DNA-binding ferritin-like protein